MSSALPGYVAACVTPDQEELIKRLAQGRQLTVSALIRAWINEHAQQELRRGRRPPRRRHEALTD